MSDISPTFALEAEDFFSQKDFSKAIELSKKGILKYPDYALGYRILLKSLFEASEFSEAIDIADNAIEIFPNDKYFKDFRLRLIQKSQESAQEEDAVQEEKSVQEEDLIFDETIENINYDYTEPELLKSNNFNLIPGLKSNLVESSNFDAKIKISKFSEMHKSRIKQESLLSEKFSNISDNIKSIEMGSKITNEPANAKQKSSKATTISETLASIYYKQGALEQALEAYKNLNKISTNHKYKEIISEIENKIKSK